jgi:hypothetical protein
LVEAGSNMLNGPWRSRSGGNLYKAGGHIKAPGAWFYP